MSETFTACGAKRFRDNNGEHDDSGGGKSSFFYSSRSSNAASIEIINGVTRSAAEAYEKESCAFVSKHKDLDALLNCTLFRQKAYRFLSLPLDGDKFEGPVEIGVIQLVANDCRTLVFTSEAILPVNVSAAVGRRVCIGDKVLFQRFAASNQSEENEVNIKEYGVAAAVEFVALDLSAVLDAGDWCHAVSWNVSAAAKWLQKLLSCPIGLAQMTCIIESYLGDVEASATAADAWLRSLQLPVFLKQAEKINRVDTRKVYQLQRFILSMLHLYVAILSSAEDIMTLHCMVEVAVYQFIASPLFVDGLSLVLPQLAGNVSESTWSSARNTMLDAMNLAMRYVFRELIVCEGKWQLEAKRNAERGFLTVLHRISGIWLTPEKSLPQAGTEAFVKLVEEMARNAVFRRATQWVYHKEQVTDTVSLLDRAHLPPTLQDIKDLYGLKETTVAEMMAAMTETYVPYFRQEPVRFVECAMLAAYAELYGPVARAVSYFIETASIMRLENVEEPSKDKPLRVLQVFQTATRSTLSEYSLEEVQLNALFGLPLLITLQIADKTGFLDDLNVSSSFFGCIVVILDDKTFLFPVVVSGLVHDMRDDDGEKEEEGMGKRTVFTAVVYALRDKDMLQSLVAVVSVNYGGHESSSGAWFFCDAALTDSTKKKNSNYSGSCDEHVFFSDYCSGHNCYSASSFVPRFMAEGTSALSYMLYIFHLQALRFQLRREGQNVGSSGIGALRVKGTQEKRDVALKGGVFWWKSDSSGNSNNNNDNNSNNDGINSSSGGCSKVGSVFFAHCALMKGESEALQNCLSELTAAAVLTPSQVECLHVLSTLGPGVRALAGAVGSGKTTLMHAGSISRGRAQEVLRRQHQSFWHATVKRSGETLLLRLAELAAAEQIEDLFIAVDGTLARDIAEEVTNAALEHIQAHVLLSENVRHCSAPMLLRPRGLKQTPPLHILRVLKEESNVTQSYCSLNDIMMQSHKRSLNAPIVTVLNSQLQLLRRLGDFVNSIRASLEDNVAAQDGEWKLYLELLPWIMSKKERLDTVVEAGRQRKTWTAYLSEDLWDEQTVTKGSDMINGVINKDVWKGLEPAVSFFSSVTLPNSSRSLCEYSQSEALGWRAVFGEKQKELLFFLQREILDETQHLFALYFDVVMAVAAVSQTSRMTVVTAIGSSVLQELFFLRAWQPPYLFIDDYDQISDALYLTLFPAASVIISHQAEPPLQHEERLSLVILRALQKELQGTQFSSTVMLAESFRLSSPGFHKAVELCRSSSVSFSAPLTLGAGTVSGKSVSKDASKCYMHRGALPGFSSPSCVEFWTHAVPLSASVACDGLAAAFVRNRIQRSDPSILVRIYSGILEDKAAIVEGMMLDVGDTGLIGDTELAISTLSFFSDNFVERDEECDVAVLCLSGIARQLRCDSAVERQEKWGKLASEQLFVEHMKWWLWRTMSYARRGAVLVGSKEVFSFIAPLQRLERFVLQAREQCDYWLPSEAGGSALALQCSEHANSRQLALITYTEYGGCQVRVIGMKTCRSLCLAQYENCTNSSHACLSICHAPRGKGDNLVEKNAEHLHSNCPFPCAKAQSCGHTCARRCCEPCSPCEFVGLRELLCGQRVVSGLSDAGPAMELVHHFQRVRCGESPRPCDERVTLRCQRCGEKTIMPCHEVVARGGMSSAVLTELECAGCVALFNRVAREFVVNEIVQSTPPLAGGISLEALPEVAQSKLQKLRGIAAKKAQLMLQKEALETMQGKSTSEFYQLRNVYAQMKKQQDDEARAHSQRVQENIALWAKKLKQKYEEQIAVNEEIYTEVPFLVTEATIEEERQRSFTFL